MVRFYPRPVLIQLLNEYFSIGEHINYRTIYSCYIEEMFRLALTGSFSNLQLVVEAMVFFQYTPSRNSGIIHHLTTDHSLVAPVQVKNFYHELMNPHADLINRSSQNADSRVALYLRFMSQANSEAGITQQMKT